MIDTAYYLCIRGFPQEYIKDDAGVVLHAWIPTYESCIVVWQYYLATPDIVDYKDLRSMFPLDWASIPDNSYFLTYLQKNRLRYADCAGNYKEVYLSDHKLRYKKLTGNLMQIESDALERVMNCSPVASVV